MLGHVLALRVDLEIFRILGRMGCVCVVRVGSGGVLCMNGATATETEHLIEVDGKSEYESSCLFLLLRLRLAWELLYAYY